MKENGFIKEAEYKAAMAEKLDYKGRKSANSFSVNADYASEMARQAAVGMYGEEAYTAGITVTTTLIAKEQNAAQKALREDVMSYEMRQYFRGPEGFIELPKDANEAEDLIADKISDFPDYDELISAVVLSASENQVVVSRGAGENIKITGAGLKPAASWLNDRAPANKRLKRGAVVRLIIDSKTGPMLTQLPEVQAAFVALSSKDGAIRALAGGFEFALNKFNHVTQSTRQPGSSFKPFVYSASLEKGVMPTTIVADEPIYVPASTPGGKSWSPKNYDAKYEGPMLMKDGLAKSKNMVSIRVLQEITPQFAQTWATQFGFNPADVPPYLTMALGAVTTNPLQLASAYSVFSNGGYRIKPYLIKEIKDASGRIVAQAKPAVAGDEANRAIDTRNAFMMNQLLRGVVDHGTAVRAKSLGRSDIMGKTGTTNDSHDAWFAGFNPEIVGIAWVGYDQPKNLGNRETGGGLALPIWIDYMKVALQGMPDKPMSPPATGVTFVDGNYYYSEFTPGQGIASIGVKSEQNDIPSLFNFLKGLGGGADTEAPRNADSHSDNSTPSRIAAPVKGKKDEIEQLFGN
jgi:penicillin-binding protein 1A